jgi:hypothetical protein
MVICMEKTLLDCEQFIEEAMAEHAVPTIACTGP